MQKNVWNSEDQHLNHKLSQFLPQVSADPEEPHVTLQFGAKNVAGRPLVSRPRCKPECVALWWYTVIYVEHKRRRACQKGSFKGEFEGLMQDVSSTLGSMIHLHVEFVAVIPVISPKVIILPWAVKYGLNIPMWIGKTSVGLKGEQRNLQP